MSLSQLFEPFAVKGCADVGAEIKKVSELYAIEESLVSFDIINISTLTRGEKKKDFSLLEGSERSALLTNEAQYNQNDFELKQVYDILVRGLKDNDLAPFVKLEVDKECYELSLRLKVGLEASDDEAFFHELYKQITREKVRQHIIVRLFDEEITQEIEALKELFTSLQIKGTLQEEQCIVIGRALGYIPEVNAEFRFSLQEQWNELNQSTIDFASYAAKSGDLVGVSYKAQAGKSGRNLKGEYIPINKAHDESEAEIKIKFKESEFRKEERDGDVEYYALVDGYVSFSEGELKVLSDFNFAEVSLRKNGSLLGGDKKGFIVEVTCADPNQDAIGASITLEASEIKIYGGIAENAKIVAKKAEINGQTHQSTMIVCDELNIDILKGSAIGHKIHANRLELGEINGEEVFIQQASGGKINAKNLKINELYSNASIAISESLELGSIQGGGNKITLSSRASLLGAKQAQNASERIDSNLKRMNALLNVLNKDLVRVKKTKPVIEKIKLIMEENKKNNKPNEKNITDSIAQYMILLRRTKYFKEQLLTLQEESKKLGASLEELDLRTKEAKIIAQSPWQKENEIIFESFIPESKDMLILSDGEDVDISIDAQTLKLVREIK